MTFPATQHPAPGVVTKLAAGRPVTAVWHNELGGVTFSIDGGAEYVKTGPGDFAASLVPKMLGAAFGAGVGDVGLGSWAATVS